MTNLVIMESPPKATTVKSYLGSSYKVVASKGHIRDLPKSTLGIDIDNGFEAHYINIRGKGDLIKDLKKEVKNADRVYLATDPDREGEAIAWHLVNALDIPPEKAKRVTFNAVTKSVVKESIKHPRDIDMDIVNAQQTRRILDRIVGYKLSPFLWKSVKSGLSAGRVQSVATRIIVDRENEIRAFVPQEYWTIEASVIAKDGKSFEAKFFGRDNGDKIDLNTEADAMAVYNAVSGQDFTVADIKLGKRLKNPAPPFTTSTLQQEASRKLNFQSQRTMRVAQARVSTSARSSAAYRVLSPICVPTPSASPMRQGTQQRRTSSGNTDRNTTPNPPASTAPRQTHRTRTKPSVRPSPCLNRRRSRNSSPPTSTGCISSSGIASSPARWNPRSSPRCRPT